MIFSQCIYPELCTTFPELSFLLFLSLIIPSIASSLSVCQLYVFLKKNLSWVTYSSSSLSQTPSLQDIIIKMFQSPK